MPKLSIHRIIERAKKFAAPVCPACPFPSDGSALARVRPMLACLRQLALKVPARKNGYQNAAAVFKDLFADISYAEMAKHGRYLPHVTRELLNWQQGLREQSAHELCFLETTQGSRR